MSYHKTLLAAGALLSFTALSVEASLTAGIAGGQSVVYSSASNITWTGDANLLGTLITNQGYSSVVNAIIAASPNFGSYSVTAGDFNSSSLGLVSWFGAQAFTSYLKSINYAGSNQWALPSAGANPQVGFNPTGSQFGELFYNELSGSAGNPIPDTGYFTNEQAYAYWLGTEYAPPPGGAWGFATGFGYQGNDSKGRQFFAWAVSPGNVAAVPVPGAIWLFGSGLTALLGLKRRGTTLGNSVIRVIGYFWWSSSS